ncbi:ABC transporter permease [Arthrobacter sp. I2-34]|uniref:ABC transporter permease n=1 Tax=Arthrobacter hankyongi TaxID=2904801 RepID=A0ABS9L596_9MICC|nr:ABC transporter permease [Arthrobacter hankyongi]MCG2621748.1 ABC transporter permease [Arthrobacter hankyongi]
MQWFLANFPYVMGLTGLHLYQAMLPLVLGFLISLPLGYLAWRIRPIRGVILSVSSVLYTIPSLALFVFLPVVLGTKILDMANLIVALTLYAVALLVRAVVDALNSIDDGVRQAAEAMGYRPLRQLFTVDLPLALPVLFAGLRVVSVSNISLASVGAVIGIQNLGVLFTDGLLRSFMTEILVGIILILVLAVLLDGVLVLTERLLTPWLRHGRGARADTPNRAGGRPGQQPDAAETAILT